MKYPLLYYVDLYSGLLPIGTSLMRLKLFRASAFVLFVYFVGNFATEFVTYVMASHNIVNLWVLHLFNLFEISLPLAFFYINEKKRLWRHAYTVVWALYIIFWFVSKFTIEPFSSQAQYTHTLSSGILSVAAVHVLVTMIKSEESIIYYDYRFWATVAILLYFSASAILFGSLNALGRLKAIDAFTVWRYQWMLSIITNLIFAGSFLWKPRS